MRGAMILLPLFLLAGCKDEPDFEARYDKAAADLAWQRTIAFFTQTLGAPPKGA